MRVHKYLLHPDGIYTILSLKERYYMKTLELELKEKESRLAELMQARSRANCSSTYSSKAEVERETEIEELEEEIEALKKQISNG